jgi:hypothetical protein
MAGTLGIEEQKQNQDIEQDISRAQVLWATQAENGELIQVLNWEGGWCKIELTSVCSKTQILTAQVLKNSCSVLPLYFSH